MPLHLIAAVIIGFFGTTLLGVGSVYTISMTYNKIARKKLKSSPNGVPRPPPGMTRSELQKAAQGKLEMDVTRYFNFGFCGGSGAGKSTLINALLNREDVDFVKGKPHNIFGSAATGVWQTTMTTLCYGYPEGGDLQHVRLWDMSGCGTHEHPSANYFEDKALFAFDVLIVVAEKELGEYEYTILENAQKQEIPVVIVITKAEEKVESRVRKLFNTKNPPLEEYRNIVQEITSEARQRIFTYLQKKGLKDTPVFTVSAWKYRDLMVNLETVGNIEHQEAMPNEEDCADELLGKEVSDQDINNNIIRDHETGMQATVESEALTKTALLSFELCQLLKFIADTAVHRRL